MKKTIKIFTMPVRKTRKPFKLHNATFKGKGLQPAVRNATWDELRELIYTNRGA